MPQRKSFQRRFFDNGGTWAILFLGAFILALFMSLNEGLSARHLAEEGVQAQATVISLYETTSRSVRSTRHLYNVGLTFVVDQETVHTKKTVPESFYNSMRTGMVIPIVYWTGDPTLIEVRPGSFSERARQSLFVAVVAAAFTLFFGGPAGHWALTARWMARNGVERRVEITKHVECEIPIQSKKWQLVWREPSGTLAMSRFHHYADLPAVGRTITVLSDPEGRRDSIWEGDFQA
ncbi:hypothetical protein MCELHM10_03292 [Paracoccaceae bacterium]